MEMVVKHAGMKLRYSQCRELYVLNFSDAGYLLDSCVHGVCVCVLASLATCLSCHGTVHIHVQC